MLGTSHEEVAQHTIPMALQGISVDDMWEFLGKTEKDMENAFPRVPTMAATIKGVKRSDKYAPYTKYLDHLSGIVHKELGWSTNAIVINKLTGPIRQPLREALGGSYPFLRSP